MSLLTIILLAGAAYGGYLFGTRSRTPTDPRVALIEEQLRKADEQAKAASAEKARAELLASIASATAPKP